MPMTAPSPEISKKRMHAFEVIASKPWAILPDHLEMICSIARRENESIEAVAAKLGRPLQNTRTVEVRDGVAIVPVTGPVFRYANLFTDISGATSLEVLATDFSTAENDPAIKAIVLNMDTPGGEANGIAEFAQMVRSASKPVVAYVDGMAASAGYWIASAANEIVMSKTGEVGSIGAVVGVQASKDQRYIEIVSSQSPKKRPDVNTADGRQQIQARIDALAQVFVEDVANYRNVETQNVLDNFGQGDMRMGEEAVALGMADRVSTLENVIAGLSGKSKGASQYMATDKGQPVATKPDITRAYLAEHHSDLVQAIHNEGVAAATADVTAAQKEYFTAGATAERERIQGVLAQSIPGHEKLVQALAFDGETTPEKAAMQVLAAEKTARTTSLTNHKADAPKPVTEPSIDEEQRETSGEITKESCHAEWEASKQLQAEFKTSASYFAYKKVEAKNQHKR